MDLTYICRIFYPTATECTFFSAAHGNFSVIDHILEHKANLNTCNKITSWVLSDHNGLKLKINSKRNYRKHSNTQRLKNSI
jgi:hypothetical protein